MTDQPQEEQRGHRVNIGPGGSLDLDNAFTYHPPFGDQVMRYQEIREAGKDLAVLIEDLCPPGPERSTAITKIREAVMWANASIACGEKMACTCTYGFNQAEGMDPKCPKHGEKIQE